MFTVIDPEAWLDSRRAMDAERGAEVREISAPPRRDGDSTSNTMLLQWANREITFTAMRIRINDYSLSAEGEVIESPRPPYVDILGLGHGALGRDGHEFVPYVFGSDAEYFEAHDLAAAGFVAWYPMWKSSRVCVLSRERACRQDPDLGDLNVVNVATFDVTPIGL